MHHFKFEHTLLSVKIIYMYFIFDNNMGFIRGIIVYLDPYVF